MLYAEFTIVALNMFDLVGGMTHVQHLSLYLTFMAYHIFRSVNVLVSRA